MAKKYSSMKRRDVLKTVGAVSAAAAVGPYVFSRSASAADELVVVSWGGARTKAFREVIFKDFEREYGVRVQADSPPTSAKVKAMVDSGNVTWDVLDTDMPAILTMVRHDLLEPIDYDALDKSKLKSIPKELKTEYGLGHIIYSFNIVYNTDHFPTGKHPQSWVDVWDGDNFPGGRTFNFGGGVSPQLEIALLGDGVSMDNLYPLDVERAWDSYDKLRPLVSVWYGSHSEAIQTLSTGEAHVGNTIGPRGITARRNGAPVNVDFNQGKLAADNWAIIKASPKRELAHKFINFAIAAEREAGMAKRVPYGPGNQDAFKYLSEDEAKDLNTAPQNIDKQFWWNVEWWGTPGPDGKTPREKQAERFARWMVQGG